MEGSTISDTQLHESRQPEMLKLTITFLVLAVLFVIARFWSGRYRKAPIGIDDYMILVALTFTFATFACAIVEISYGNGLHTAVVPPQNTIPFFKAVFAISLVYASAITSIKLSILLFYRRLFDVPTFRLITTILGGVIVVWWFAVVFIGVFECHPIEGVWDKSIHSTCINASRYYIGVAVPNIATDIALLVLPVRIVWRLQTTLGQKIALSVTFLTGGLVVVVSLYRIVKLFVINNTDPFWTLTDATIWTSVEPSVGILCACLPTLRPLLNLLLPRLGFSRYASRYIKHGLKYRHRIGLESDGDGQNNSSPSIKLSTNHGNWKRTSLSFREDNGVSQTTEITSTKLKPDPERDEMLLAGISVIHDVDIKRTLAV